MDHDTTQPNELKAFLPPNKETKDEGNLLKSSINVSVIQVGQKIVPDDIEKSTLYDPFRNRNVSSGTTDGETLIHLLKACLGSGILAMPYAFHHGGSVFSVLATIIVGIICAHCAYILVRSAHVLYHRLKVPVLTFPQIGEMTFAHGPEKFKKFAKPSRMLVILGIFLTYFGTCCAYTVIIASNLEQVIKHHGIWDSSDKRWFIIALLFPLILLNYIQNLKTLALFSLTANILMGLTLIITLVHVFIGSQLYNPFTDLPLIDDWSRLPKFFSITIFAMECIGVIMPLENKMRKPTHFLGNFGIMNIGMTIVTITYLLLGLFGYMKYGNHTKELITLNLNIDRIESQLAKVFIAVAVFFTYGLQFYVCFDIVWNGIKDKIPKNYTLINYIVRTILVLLTVIVAVAVPEISPLLTIVGALFFSFLGLLFPAIIDLIIYWDEGFGTYYFRLIKNTFIILFGILAMIFGTWSGIEDAIKTQN